MYMTHMTHHPVTLSPYPEIFCGGMKLADLEIKTEHVVSIRRPTTKESQVVEGGEVGAKAISPTSDRERPIS